MNKEKEDQKLNLRQEEKLKKAMDILGRIAYPRRGSADEYATIQCFADEIQKQFTREDFDS